MLVIICIASYYLIFVSTGIKFIFGVMLSLRTHIFAICYK